jgi:hypothetical protein
MLIAFLIPESFFADSQDRGTPEEWGDKVSGLGARRALLCCYCAGGGNKLCDKKIYCSLSVSDTDIQSTMDQRVQPLSRVIALRGKAVLLRRTVLPPTNLLLHNSAMSPQLSQLSVSEKCITLVNNSTNTCPGDIGDMPR